MSHLPKHVKDRIKENKKTGRFTGGYVSYDLAGRPNQVRCMCCKTAVAGPQPARDANGNAILVTAADGQKYAAMTMANYYNRRQVTLEMKDPSGKVFICNPIVCSDCHDRVVAENRTEDLWACVMAGWENEQGACRWPDQKSKDYFKMFKDAKPVRVKEMR